MADTLLAPFAQYSEELQPQIEAGLQARTILNDGCPPALREAVLYGLLAPGKRLRPMLVLLAARACGGRVEQAMPAACAVEMVHAYSLIHDDLPAIDNDDLRRGRATCHKKFGEALAILAGDALLTLAFEIIAGEIEPPQVALRCSAALARAAGPCCMIGGQADDIAGPKPDAGMEALESIHHRKTGAMIKVSLNLGALIAGADNRQAKALSDYGRCLGLAFQITDDLLDVCGNEQVTGKKVGKDMEHGKLTFPGLLGVQQSTARAEELIREACQSLRLFQQRADGLEALARYVLERNR